MSDLAASIIIPTVGRAQQLADTLDALIEQDVPPGTFDVTVVIDGSDPASDRAVADRAGRIEIRSMESPGKGQGPARNAGARLARGSILIFLDDDIRACPGLVAAHLRRHEARPGIAVTGSLPVERIDPEPAHHRAIREWWAGELEEMARPGHVSTFRDFVTGNVSLPRSCFERVGGFAPVFTGYGREDYELGYRLLCAGLSITHEPEAVGVHRFRKPVRQWIRQFGTMGRADIRFIRLHPQAATEVAGLTAKFMVARFGRLPRLAEELAVRLNDGGGSLWGRAARYAQIAYYWHGVRTEASPGELEMFLSAWRLALAEGRQRKTQGP